MCWWLPRSNAKIQQLLWLPTWMRYAWPEVKDFVACFLHDALAKKNHARAGISRDCARARNSHDQRARFPPAHWFFASYMMTHRAKMCNINHIPLAYFVPMFLFDFHPWYLVKGREQIVFIQHWLKDRGLRALKTALSTSFLVYGSLKTTQLIFCFPSIKA